MNYNLSYWSREIQDTSMHIATYGNGRWDIVIVRWLLVNEATVDERN
jgi:hypothetical protein